MASVNKVIIIGNLGKDPEMRYMPSGDAIANLRIATTDLPCEEGVVLVVEILTSKSTYNTLELTSGRMAKVSKGDIIVGALGHRQALFGYSGHLPTSVKEGDIIQVLNIGGVLGIIDSANPDKGKPFDCRVLGVVLQFPYLGERIGVPAKVGYRPLDYNVKVDTKQVPVVALAGTCMEAGKTAAACAIVSRPLAKRLACSSFRRCVWVVPRPHSRRRRQPGGQMMPCRQTNASMVFRLTPAILAASAVSHEPRMASRMALAMWRSVGSL